MNFEATPDQRAAAATYRAIALRHFAPSPRRGFDWATWRALSEAGLWRTLGAGRDAGADASLNVFIAAFEAIVAATRSVGFAMALANQATVIRALLLHGTPAQRDRFLPALTSGAVAATAISEKGTGTEIRALQSRVTLDGQDGRLDGHKYNISHAPDAALILVAASATHDGRPGTALVLLDPQCAGVTRTAPQETLGVADLPIGDMTFDGVPVGTDDLLCSPKDGLRVLMDIASMNRALFGLLCADVVGPFLDDALAYVGERGALGVTLDKHQHVQRRLVDIHVGAERSRWMALAALDQLRAGDPSALASCSIAKLGGARDLTQAALHLLAIYGSDGYRRGPLATFVADALAMGTAGGTEEMHARNIFSQMQRRATASHMHAA
ncbi:MULTISPECIES: acyl-CoA dehydrogenase family protein [Burkholderia]|uniref:acyl-CoA dehydrogenase family protein n=1 Tax=Burkholderia TaxID=32008 RepID=UPI00064F96A9|nr:MULTISPECIES: acyl-CoA dehydrogenase family protein [Burkholderia]KML21597.1 acyl-CoA dehydrogenase [Burkholderia cepacia]KMN60664.1 acyl-CoA dehydrogenase [Burkholderia sp. LK4]